MTTIIRSARRAYVRMIVITLLLTGPIGLAPLLFWDSKWTIELALFYELAAVGITGFGLLHVFWERCVFADDHMEHISLFSRRFNAQYQNIEGFFPGLSLTVSRSPNSKVLARGIGGGIKHEGKMRHVYFLSPDKLEHEFQRRGVAILSSSTDKC